MAGSINDGDHVLGSLKLPQGDIYRDTTFTLRLQLIEHPCFAANDLGFYVGRICVEQLLTIFERTFSELSGFFFKLLDGTFIDTTALVDQMTCGRGFSGVDVTDDCNELKMKDGIDQSRGRNEELLFSHLRR
jgi:hypothetical protein